MQGGCGTATTKSFLTAEATSRIESYDPPQSTITEEGAGQIPKGHL